MKFDLLDRLESKTTITEPISVTGLSISALRGMIQLGIMHPNGGSADALRTLLRAADRVAREGVAPRSPIVIHRDLLPAMPHVPATRGSAQAGGFAHLLGSTPQATKSAPHDPTNDWLTLTPSSIESSDPHGISTPWHPAKSSAHGAAQAPRGGS